VQRRCGNKAVNRTANFRSNGAGNPDIQSVSKSMSYAQTKSVNIARARRQTATAHLTARPEERGATIPAVRNKKHQPQQTIKDKIRKGKNFK
jgi:hypothetical protein